MAETYCTAFMEDLPPEKQAEGLGVQAAVILGECFRCKDYARCSTDETFKYVIPFWVAFGWGRSLGVLFFSHAIVDAMKARYHKISYWLDQTIHYAVLAAYLLWRWAYGST